MSYLIDTPFGEGQKGVLDYEIGDFVMNDRGQKLGKCTGFDGGCILIDGKCWGGMYYFHKVDWIDIEHEVLD